MAITNDAVYQSRIIAPSFVSSNMYYGCVQHCKKKETQHNVMLEHIGISKPSLIDCCSYDTFMEIDEDGCDYSMTSDYLNNDSIILKATVQNQLKTSDKLQSQQQTTYDADMLQRRSRKRHNSDFNPTSQLKKLRRGGGKDHVHEDTTKDYGSTITSCESEAFEVNIIDNNVQQSMIKNKNWAVDSYINLNNSNCEELLFNDSHKSLENIVEYENMLFETHGCSIYQFYRLQLDNNDCTEF